MKIIKKAFVNVNKTLPSFYLYFLLKFDTNKCAKTIKREISFPVTH